MTPNKRRLKQDLLVLRVKLLQTISDDPNLTLSQVAKRLNISAQLLQYYASNLAKEGIIEKTNHGTYSSLSLTPKGRSIKEKLVQSEGTTSLWRCHNLIVAWPVLNWGGWTFQNKKMVPMSNWEYTIERVPVDGKEWVLHIQTTGLVKIYCPSEYTTDNPDQCLERQKEEAWKLVRTFEEIHKMSLGSVRLIRKGQKELQNSTKLAELFKGTKIDGVWADASNGTLNLEEDQDKTAIEKLLLMPDTMELIVKAVQTNTNHIINQTEVMSKFTEQIALHLTVMQRISGSMDEMSKMMKQMGDYFEQHKRE